jgi:hypothetical protein
VINKQDEDLKKFEGKIKKFFQDEREHYKGLIDNSFKKIENEISTYENEKQNETQILKSEIERIREVVDVSR